MLVRLKYSIYLFLSVTILIHYNHIKTSASCMFLSFCHPLFIHSCSVPFTFKVSFCFFFPPNMHLKDQPEQWEDWKKAQVINWNVRKKNSKLKHWLRNKDTHVYLYCVRIFRVCLQTNAHLDNGLRNQRPNWAIWSYRLELTSQR